MCLEAATLVAVGGGHQHAERTPADPRSWCGSRRPARDRSGRRGRRVRPRADRTPDGPAPAGAGRRAYPRPPARSARAAGCVVVEAAPGRRSRASARSDARKASSSRASAPSSSRCLVRASPTVPGSRNDAAAISSTASRLAINDAVVVDDFEPLRSAPTSTGEGNANCWWGGCPRCGGVHRAGPDRPPEGLHGPRRRPADLGRAARSASSAVASELVEVEIDSAAPQAPRSVAGPRDRGRSRRRRRTSGGRRRSVVRR